MLIESQIFDIIFSYLVLNLTIIMHSKRAFCKRENLYNIKKQQIVTLLGKSLRYNQKKDGQQ